MQLFSPAKINLFLRVMSRRLDGFHNLATLMQAIDLGDTLHFQLSKRDIFTTTTHEIPCDPSNFILRAVTLFRQKTGKEFGITIHLEKNIPPQAGLGGGSSNVATTLYALNELLHTKISEKELQSWSQHISSDAPFFFSQGTAYCRGKGEIVEEIEELVLPRMGLVKPPMGLSTPEIFRDLDLSRCSSTPPDELLRSFFERRPIYENDLQEKAFTKLPHLASLKEKLARDAECVMMTGSGTGLICFGPKKTPDLEIFPIRRTGGWYTL
ncbi:MAG: 4-(cytidine 5'-diphospho)-2-C-methyl-D-erythritol kinase [Chlamydiales bacterium]